MRVKGVALQHIRKLDNLTLNFAKQTSIIVGPNASGKTTVIEALSLISSGNSFRATKIEEMIAFGEELGRIKVAMEELVDSETGTDEIEVMLTSGLVQGQKSQKRIFVVNGVKRRRKDAVGKFYAVVFRPEDMRLVEGSPSRRRNFMDTVLSSLYPEYARALGEYEKVLKRRNKLLTQVRDGEQPTSTLEYWNLALLKNGTILQKHRRDMLEDFRGADFPLKFLVDYEPSVISADRLKQYVSREIASGHTLIGPHKDDFFVSLSMVGEFRDVAIYGSRGQQRLAVLWLKFCELQFATSVLNQKPLLLLDDILSELDDSSRSLVLRAMKAHQSVITTVDNGIAKEIVQQLESSQVFNF